MCIDARTGKRVWHFQLIHHDIWDYDVTAAPVLLDHQRSRQAHPRRGAGDQAGPHLRVRPVTGKPVWPIVERKVPQSDVPGEVTSRTQPIPTLPEPFERQGVTEDELQQPDA